MSKAFPLGHVTEVHNSSASNLETLYSLNPPKVLADYQTEQQARSEARSSGSTANSLLSIDYGDFLTRRITLAAEKGHIVSAARRNITRANQVVCSTSALSFFLSTYSSI